MKRMLTLLTGIAMSCSALAQVDSTSEAPKSDTIRIGKMIIVRTKGSAKSDNEESTRVYRRSYKPSNLSTNWFVFDIGFTNFNDQTNYSSAGAQAFAPGANGDWFDLKAIKSTNVNIWLFMQRLNVIKHVVNLKYGLGIDMNNYRFDEPVKFQTNPTMVIMDNSTHYKKNKLVAEYVTVPMLLDFDFTPKREKGFGLALGVSAGYLYASRQKTITDADGKRKKKDDFDLRPWKLQYLAELGLGPVKLYGSYASQSIFEKGLDLTPYSVGVRISSW